MPGAPTLDPANPLASQTSHEGDTISLQLHALSTTGFAAAVSVGNLPPGLTIDTSTGLITGILPFTAATGVPYNVPVTVTDTSNSLTVTGQFAWTVIDVNVPPSLNPIPDQTTSHNVAVAFPVSGSDFDSTRAPCDLVSFSVVSVVPTGSTPPSPLPTLTAVNVPSEQADQSCAVPAFHATLAGSSSVDGVYAVTVRASDTKPVPGTDTRTFTWTVQNHPPTIDGAGRPARSTPARRSRPSPVSATDPDNDPLTFTDLVGAAAHAAAGRHDDRGRPRLGQPAGGRRVSGHDHGERRTRRRGDDLVHLDRHQRRAGLRQPARQRVHDPEHAGVPAAHGHRRGQRSADVRGHRTPDRSVDQLERPHQRRADRRRDVPGHADGVGSLGRHGDHDIHLDGEQQPAADLRRGHGESEPALAARITSSCRSPSRA